MQINRKELTAILRAIDGVLLSKNTIPILDNILLSSDGVTLQLSATNLTSSVHAEIPFNSALECTVHGKTLSRIVQAMSADTITFELQGKDLVVAGDGRFKLRTVNVKEFPNLPSKDEGYHFRFNRTELLEAFRLSGFMLEGEDVSFGTEAFKGVAQLLVQTNLIESKFTLTSTNRHVLSWVDGLCEKAQDVEDGEILFPRSTIHRLNAILAASDDDLVMVTDTPNHIFIEVGHLTYSFLKSHAKFTDVSGAVSAQFTANFTVNSKQMCSALKRMQIIADKNLHRTMWNIQKDALVMSGIDTRRGDGEESFDIQLNGEPFITGFDLNYALNIFTRTDEDVECQFMPSANGHAMKTSYTGTNIKAMFFVQGLNPAAFGGQNGRPADA